jgi:hypothetical protein
MSIRLESDWQSYLDIARAEGCTSREESTVSSPETWQQHLAAARSRWPDYQRYYQHLVESKPRVSADIRSVLRSTPSALIDQAQASRFDVVTDPNDWRSFLVFNTDGKSIGWLQGSWRFKSQCDAQDYARPRNTQPFEFIALAMTAMWHISPDKGGRCTDAMGTEMTCVPMVPVMQITWKGVVAYREAVGMIFFKDWAASKREWKTVILA